MAAPKYTNTGGGSDYQCLPNNPVWGRRLPNFQSSGRLFGTEYKISLYLSQGVNGLFSNINARRVNFHNAPCAVCLTYMPRAVIMIPGRKRCDRGWKLEYSGYLMSERYTYRRTEYVCVDKDPEASESGNGWQHSAGLYHVEAMCGSLPCPWYVQGFEMACAVCSRGPYPYYYKKIATQTSGSNNTSGNNATIG